MSKIDIDTILKADKIMKRDDSKLELINYLKSAIENKPIDKRIKCARIDFISEQLGKSYKNVQGHIFRNQYCSTSLLCDYVRVVKENIKKFPFSVNSNA